VINDGHVVLCYYHYVSSKLACIQVPVFGFYGSKEGKNLNEEREREEEGWKEGAKEIREVSEREREKERGEKWQEERDRLERDRQSQTRTKTEAQR
jgi:hypothetical protein